MDHPNVRSFFRRYVASIWGLCRELHLSMCSMGMSQSNASAWCSELIIREVPGLRVLI